MTDELEIVSFESGGVQPQHSTPDVARLLSGQPQLTTWNHYADPSEQFFAGIWSATRGRWRVTYSEHEFCHLLAGRIAIVSATGTRCEFAAGATFVIPA